MSFRTEAFLSITCEGFSCHCLYQGTSQMSLSRPLCCLSSSAVRNPAMPLQWITLCSPFYSHCFPPTPKNKIKIKKHNNLLQFYWSFVGKLIYIFCAMQITDKGHSNSFWDVDISDKLLKYRISKDHTFKNWAIALSKRGSHPSLWMLPVPKLEEHFLFFSRILSFYVLYIGAFLLPFSS